MVNIKKPKGNKPTNEGKSEEPNLTPLVEENTNEPLKPLEIPSNAPPGVFVVNVGKPGRKLPSHPGVGGGIGILSIGPIPGFSLGGSLGTGSYSRSHDLGTGGGVGRNLPDGKCGVCNGSGASGSGITGSSSYSGSGSFSGNGGASFGFPGIKGGNLENLNPFGVKSGSGSYSASGSASGSGSFSGSGSSSFSASSSKFLFGSHCSRYV